MNRRTVAVVSVLLVVLILIGVGIFAFTRRNTSATPTPAGDETQISRATAAPPRSSAAAATVTGIGSGGTTSGSWYDLAFTAPIYPNNAANHKGGLEDKLVTLMDTATKTLDVADYDFDLASVADAMVRAKGRGVIVRMVTDTDTLTNVKDMAIQSAFGKLKGAGIPVVDDQRSAIMHDKFTVVDNATVQTGSWNYTDGDTYHLNNNMIVIRNAQIAQNYTTEFNKMFEKRAFGPKKEKGTPNPVVMVDGTRVENLFAPKDDTVGRIVETVNGAKSSVYFMAFSFTQDKIGQAIIARQKAGVTVSGVFETTGSQTEFSEYGIMKKAGLDVYTDGNPWVMHHKVIIVDEHIVIFGSFNFSDGAATQNDENLLIVDNADIAKAFKAEYDRVLALAKNPPTKK